MRRRVLAFAVGAVAALVLAGCTAQAAPVHHHKTTTVMAKDCDDLVGQPTSDAIQNGKLACSLPDASLIKTNCDPVNNTSTAVYGWFSKNRATNVDLNVYAGKVGGDVVIVPGGSDAITDLGGETVAGYLSAVGC